jgi:hypothetical protein
VQQERTVSRFTFELLTLATMFAMVAVASVVVIITFPRLGLDWGPISWVHVVIGLLGFFGARLLVDRGLKAVGLSRSGRLVEARRPAEPNSGYDPVEEVIEIRYPRSQTNGWVLVCLIFVAMMFVLFEVIIPKRDQRGREHLPLLYGMFLGFAAIGYLMRYVKIIRIDPLGVTAYRTKYLIRPTMIPWSQIASCDLVVVRDTFGKVAVTYPVLRDAAGKKLFVGLAAAFAMTPEDQQVVLCALKQRFPKVDLD